ncbi:MAG TPA: hypothetical protein PKL23_05020, partial [Candidatus Egerieousia sp.]|nr:hypothetical protein [Candidatus Egerieousia sp.]
MENGFYLYTVPINVNGEFRSMITNFFEIVSNRIISFDISSTEISNISYPVLYSKSGSHKIVVDQSAVYDYLSSIDKKLTSYKSRNKHVIVKMVLNHGEVFQNMYRPTLTAYACNNAVKYKIVNNKPESYYYTDLPIERGREYLFYLNQINLIIDDLNKAARIIYFCRD